MGLFSFKKSPSKGAQLNWLETVDAAYAKAFAIKNVAGLEEYFTRTCLSKLMQRVRLGEKAYSGLARYQHTSWVKVADNGETMQFKKTVTYDQIKMSQGIVASVGEGYIELWTVVKENGIDKVSEIRRE